MTNLDNEVRLVERRPWNMGMNLPYVVTKRNEDGTFQGKLNLGELSAFQRAEALAARKAAAFGF